LNRDKADVKMLYAAIIRQAIIDWKTACKTDNRKLKRDVRNFFKSEWCALILDVLNLDIRIINDKYDIIK